MPPIRLLILEDRPSDALLVIHELRRAGYQADWRRVETEQDYLAALDPDLDLVLSDYALPQFDALRALRLTRERGLDIPFIIVSGAIGEEIAVMAMQQGADDYLLKDRLARLGQAVGRAIEQHELRRANRRAEAALRESAALHQAVLRSLSAQIAVLDEQGTIITVNDAWAQFAREPGTRLLPPTDVGASYLAACQAAAAQSDEAATALAGLEAILSGEQTQFTMEYAAPAPGERRWFQMHALALVGRRGAVVSHEDITERKQLEAQYIAAQKMESVGRLAGGVAHDFNNLLTAIGSYAELARQSLDGDHPAYADMQEITNNVRRAAHLTRQLLAFARRQIVAPEVFNLNDLVANIDSLLRRLIGEDIQLVIVPGPDLGSIRADPGQIEQVLVNLIVNARDAMPRGGTIMIETANVYLDQQYTRQHGGIASGEHVLLSVSDTGLGMTEQVRQHVFEPFFTTKEVGRGTGLGLATCYGIVKQCGGNIWIYSEPGLGTTIKLYLPRAAGASGGLPRRQSPPELLQLAVGDETILLVEDDPAVRTVAARALLAHGYTVIEATNGEEALQIGQARADQPIDLLLTDVVMPRRDGKALAEALRGQSPELRVLFMSGYTDNIVLEHGLLMAGFELLQKPFSPQELLLRVRQMLDASLDEASAGV
jgi:signal transduction histidine kinase/DNA-binding response OmpR family regulator